MKQLPQLAIGLCGGAVIAFLYHTAYVLPENRTVGSSPGILPGRDGSASGDATLAAVEELPAEAGSAYASAGDWAFVDPAGFASHAETAQSIESLIAGLDILLATDPVHVLEIVARHFGRGTPEIDELYFRAIRAVVARDPAGAIARLQAEATGPQRSPILAAIAGGYAAVDADAALQWAASLIPPSSDALDAVIEKVAAADLLRAYGMMQRVQDQVVNAPLLASAMARAAFASGQAPASVASALAMRGEASADRVLAALMQIWTPQDPGRAVAWMNDNEAFLTDELIRAAVYNLAFEDVTLAAEFTERVPDGAQTQWLAEVANRYGQFDIAAALGWLPRYEGRTGYAEILNRTLLGAATFSRSLPQTETVARFIESTNADVSYESVMRTAYSYADLDPTAATQWALGLSDPERQAWAAASVADGWAGNDAPAAQRWALAQPRGALRDEMLGAILAGGVFYEGLDRRALVQAFSSPAAAQESIHQFIIRDVVNRRDVTAESQAQIEWMLERLTDPELRRQAEAQIAAAR